LNPNNVVIEPTTRNRANIEGRQQPKLAAVGGAEKLQKTKQRSGGTNAAGGDPEADGPSSKRPATGTGGRPSRKKGGHRHETEKTRKGFTVVP